MNPKQTTKRGTPLSPKWDQDWITQVENEEHQLNRRICGAHAPDHAPCQLTSTHKNGRCRYHGGLDGIGAPLGNRNAIIHGLYSRRLQQCGDHCALWKTCPMPSKDIQALPPKKRPHCVYEREEYDRIHAALDTQPRQGATAPCPHSQIRTSAQDDPPEPESAGDILLHHNIATFQVMLTRAQAALGWHTYTEETRADGKNYTMRSSKISALLQAEKAIARELRQWLRLLANDALCLALNITKTEPEQSVGLAELLEPILMKSEGVMEDAIEYQRRIDAGEIDPDLQPA